MTSKRTWSPAWRYAEQFGDFGKFGRDDELVGAVCRG
jgi:hypothetical protein